MFQGKVPGNESPFPTALRPTAATRTWQRSCTWHHPSAPTLHSCCRGSSAETPCFSAQSVASWLRWDFHSPHSCGMEGDKETRTAISPQALWVLCMVALAWWCLMEDLVLIHAKSMDENSRLSPGLHRQLSKSRSLGVALSGLLESSWEAVLAGQEAPRSLLTWP